MNMEDEFYLNDKDRAVLEKSHRACPDKIIADEPPRSSARTGGPMRYLERRFISTEVCSIGSL
jgi:hypothetical protein